MFHTPPASSLHDMKKSVQQEQQQQQQQHQQSSSSSSSTNHTSSSSSSSSSSGGSKDGRIKLDELASLTLEDDSSSSRISSSSAVVVEGGDPAGARSWKAKHALRSHYDSVRCVAFHPTQPALLSASEDHTFKIWNLNMLAPSTSRKTTTEVEPIYTYRGHRGAVFSAKFSSDGARIVTAGADRTVRVWATAPLNLDPYATHGCGVGYGLRVLEGHNDIIWDIALHPHIPTHVFSASADGSVRLWDTDKPSPLVSSYAFPSTSTSSSPEDRPVPTCLEVIQTDVRRVIAGYKNAAVAAYDIETGKALMQFAHQDSIVGTAQINKIVTHPTLPLAIVGREDRKIEVLDLSSGRVVHSMVGHQDAVSALAMDPAGLQFFSGGHDSSLRVWDLSRVSSAGPACVQEVNVHRPKHHESVHCIAYQPNKSYVASAGADSTIKLYQ
eukprot:TRINITY_DN7653_c0_g1_i2.p1 TRINITY_DN7653_c0_g1~~TRINITY_DN7653_c0_g1_i2.p1  ORF type:complete len:481 (-),score=138.73 TRINITY_DN7653_c0_g1_i2:14-1333(-)